MRSYCVEEVLDEERESKHVLPNLCYFKTFFQQKNVIHVFELKNADESDFNVYQSVIKNALNLPLDTKDTDENQDGITNVRRAVKKSSSKASFFTPNDLVTESTILFDGVKVNSLVYIFFETNAIKL